MIQRSIEDFFSKAEIIFFSDIGTTKPIMAVLFNKNKSDVFQKGENYDQLIEYMDGKNMTLLFRIAKTFVDFSIINKDNGDALNISGVKFITGNFEEFIARVPQTAEIMLFVAGIDGQDFQFHEKTTKIHLAFQGYSVTNI